MAINTKYRLKTRRTPPTLDAQGNQTDPGNIRKLLLLNVTDPNNITTELDLTPLAAGISGMNWVWDGKPNGLGNLVLHLTLSNVEIDSSDTGN